MVYNLSGINTYKNCTMAHYSALQYDGIALENA